MFFYQLLHKINTFIRPLIINGTNNKVVIRSKRKGFIIRILGSNNTLDIGDNCRLENTQITILGDNNHIIVESDAKFDGPCHIHMEGNSTLFIGHNSGIRGVSFVLKDANIQVGSNCMFSYNILLRNNDSHMVVDSECNVTNPASDIIIKDHVWLCEQCTILKGVTVGSDSIIAYGAVVTKNCPPNTIMAGNPARVVKQNINWKNK